MFIHIPLLLKHYSGSEFCHRSLAIQHLRNICIPLVDRNLNVLNEHRYIVLCSASLALNPNHYNPVLIND